MYASGISDPAPAGTPTASMDRLNKAFTAVISQPQMRQRMAAPGIDHAR
jgi:hypothetical protein